MKYTDPNDLPYGGLLLQNPCLIGCFLVLGRNGLKLVALDHPAVSKMVASSTPCLLAFEVVAI